MRRPVVPARAAVVLLTLVLVTLVGCGGDPGVRTTGEPRRIPVELPADGSTPIVQIGDWLPLITADGHVYTDGARATRSGVRRAMAPLPPSPQPVDVALLTPDGLAAVVAEAHELGLLAAPPDYGDPQVTDSGSLTVTLTTADGSFVHRADAPDERTGVRGEDAARDRLQRFTRFLDDLGDELGDDLGPREPYVPTRWIVDTDPLAQASAADEWPFPDGPVDGCAAFPLDDGADAVTGVYHRLIRLPDASESPSRLPDAALIRASADRIHAGASPSTNPGRPASVSIRPPRPPGKFLTITRMMTRVSWSLPSGWTGSSAAGRRAGLPAPPMPIIGRR